MNAFLLGCHLGDSGFREPMFLKSFQEKIFMKKFQIFRPMRLQDFEIWNLAPNLVST